MILDLAFIDLNIKSMDSNIKIVLKYLKDKDCVESFLTLQRETGINHITYSKEIQFFKKIILKGDFNEAVNFLLTFQNRIEENHFKKIMLDIFRQKLLELIDNPNEEELKILFEKELINYCTEEEFQQLFNYLTYRSVNQIEGFQKWTIIRGRFQCFEIVIPYLDMFNSIAKQDQPEEKLQDIFEFYNKSKNSQRETFSFNRNNSQTQVAKQSIFQKNKSQFPQSRHNYGEDEPQQRNGAKNQSSDMEKQLIRNSVMNMNISGNYSQMRNKLNNSNTINIPKKINNLENNQSKIQKSQLFGEQNQTYIQKNQTFLEKSQPFTEKSQLYIQKNQSLVDKSQLFVDKNQPIIQKSQQFGDKNQLIIEKSQPFLQRNLPITQKNQSLLGKSNPFLQKNQQFAEKNQILQKSNQFVQKSNQFSQKSNQIGQKNNQFNEKNILNMDRSQNIIEKSQKLGDKIPIDNEKISNTIEKGSLYSDKRPRINASLNGPMNRQKIQSSVKIDNFMKNQGLLSASNDNTPNSYKNIKMDKSQIANNSSNYSQLGKSYKHEGKPLYPKPQDNPVVYDHLNELQSSQLNEIVQQENSQATKSVKNQRQKYAYLGGKQEDEDLEQEVKKNIQYLQQTSSVIYKNKEELQQQNFTFSSQHQAPLSVRKVTKLGATSDSKAIRTCQFSQTGNYFAVGTNSSILKIFDVQNLFIKNKFQQMSPLYQIDGVHLKSIFCLDWASNERHIVTCSNDLNIKLTQINKNFTQHKTNIIGRHDSCIRMARYTPSETRIVSCGDDSLLKVWDIGKVKKCLNLKSHTNSVSAFKMQNQNQLYSVSKDMTLKKWDLRTGDNVATSKAQESQLTYIANNTDKIVVSHKNGTVSFFSPSLQLIHAVQIHEEEIRSVQALRGENTLLTASFDGHVALFSEGHSHEPNYFQHNDTGDDKVVFATFLHSPHYHGFSSTSTQGLCHIYSYE